MVWDAFTGSTKSYLVLFPPNKITALDFIEVVYEATLEHYYYYHNNYEHIILIEDGMSNHCNHAIC